MLLAYDDDNPRFSQLTVVFFMHLPKRCSSHYSLGADEETIKAIYDLDIARTLVEIW